MTAPGYMGTSDSTRQQMTTLQQGYKPSQAVQNAQQQVTQVQSQRPMTYTSPVSQQLDDIYQQIVTRKPFSYDMNGDMLYQNAKDQYVQGGRQAMMDTMGQAAMLTGGYGNSYASTAGNQAMQQYLLQLNAMLPEFHDRAAARYNQQGDDLYNQYGLLLNQDQTAYGRYQDAMTQWNNDLAMAQNAYNNAYAQDYGAFQDTLNFWQQQAAAENNDFWASRNQAYNTVMAMLQSGRMPSADMLAMAGVSQADAEAMMPKEQTGSGQTGTGASLPKVTINIPKETEKKPLTLGEYYAQGGTTPLEDGYGPVRTDQEIRSAFAAINAQKQIEEEIRKRSPSILYRMNK